MIVYLDASALVKRYVSEAGSTAVADMVETAELVATAVISRAEVTAAFAKAVRAGLAAHDDMARCLSEFEGEWNDFLRLDVNESVVSRAAAFAWC